MLMYFIMIISIIMVLSSNSWLIMWMCLELNTFSLLPLLNKLKSCYSIECSMKYFIVQTLSSNLMIFIIMMLMSLNYKINPFCLLLILLLKMGLSPFHFWYINLFKKMNWLMTIIMFTLQKLIPFWMMIYFFINNKFMQILIISNLLMSGLGMWNEKNIQIILAFSSMNHSSWMMSSFMFSNFWWLTYWNLYSLIIISLLFYFYKLNILHINQFMNMNMKWWIKLLFCLNFLSLGGLPPFLGFLPKWFILMMLMNNNIFLLMLIMMMTFILFIYMKLWIFSLLKTKMMIYKSMYWLNNKMMMILLMTFIWLMI